MYRTASLLFSFWWVGPQLLPLSNTYDLLYRDTGVEWKKQNQDLKNTSNYRKIGMLIQHRHVRLHFRPVILGRMRSGVPHAASRFFV